MVQKFYFLNTPRTHFVRPDTHPICNMHPVAIKLKPSATLWVPGFNKILTDDIDD